MFYIHKIAAIAPFRDSDLFSGKDIRDAVENKLYAIEPDYSDIPRTVLRRMAKAVRLAVGAALPLMKDQPPVDGIILGTANGGMEESIKFMNHAFGEASLNVNHLILMVDLIYDPMLMEQADQPAFFVGERDG